MMNDYVRDHMTKDLVTLGPESTLAEVREIMLTKHIHHIPIVGGDNGRKLVGMVTSWDLVKLGRSASEYAEIKVKEIMTERIAALDPDQHLGAVADILMRHLFHAVPIVNDDHDLVGIITSTDIIKYSHAKEYPDDLGKFVQENM